MVLYAETRARRLVQVLTDAAVVVGAWVSWQLSRATHDLVAALGTPGRRLAETGDRLRGGFEELADAIGSTPLVGGALRAPVGELADAAAGVAGVGAAQDTAAAALADWLGVLVLLPAIAVIGVWAVLRLRRARRVHIARDLRDRGAVDLLALRALVTEPLGALQAVTSDPLADWRAGRSEALAALELRRHGLHPTPTSEQAAP